MQLKLAQYNAEGKFERFLELGRNPDHFVYFGDGISYIEEKEGERFPWIEHTLYKDEKDPLNRFDGLFDSRTYGNGRFILVRWCGQEWEDSIYISEMSTYAFDEAAILKYGAEEVSFVTKDKHYIWDEAAEIFSLYEHKGNIHQQPELWSKINERAL